MGKDVLFSRTALSFKHSIFGTVATYTTHLAVLAVSVPALILGFLNTKAAAQVPTVDNPFVVLTNDSANAGNFATGQYYYIQAFNGSPSSSVTAPVITTSPTFSSTTYGFVRQGTTDESLFTRPEPGHPNEIAATVPYSTGLSGAWTFHVSSTPTFSSGTVQLATTNSLVGVTPMPFVPSMTVSATNPLNPTISWTMPSGGPTVTQEAIVVADNSAPILRYNINPFSTAAVVPYGSAFSQAAVIYHSPSQSTSVSSFTIPSSNDNLNTVNVGAPVLQFGHSYSIAVELDNTSGPAVPFCQLCNVTTRSVSWFDYTPINPVSLGLPAGAVINLPTTQPVPTTSGLYAGPVYSFNAPIVTGGGLTFIDPVVAYGYIYTIGTGNPNFASVEAVTNVGTGIYQLLVWDGTKFDLVDSSLKAGDIFNFLTLPGYSNGVTEFEILLGVAQGVNPTDITAFVTGLTFTGGGTFTGTMDSLVVETVTPLLTTWVLMLSGIIGLGFLSYRNRKKSSVAIGVA